MNLVMPTCLKVLMDLANCNFPELFIHTALHDGNNYKAVSSHIINISARCLGN